MPDNSQSKVATADVLTLLLHNQHALGAAIEEIARWIVHTGANAVADSAITALDTLDKNAQSITCAILRLRNS